MSLVRQVDQLAKVEWGSRDIDTDEACPMDRTIAIGHGRVL